MSKSSMPQFPHLSHGQVASTFWAQTMLRLVSTLKWHQSPAEIAWTDAEKLQRKILLRPKVVRMHFGWKREYMEFSTIFAGMFSFARWNFVSSKDIM